MKDILDKIFEEAIQQHELLSASRRAAYRAVEAMRDDPDFDLLAHSPEMSERMHELRVAISETILTHMNSWVQS